jgi:murein DD-endopeptidase MepM/ murein hydrolase activator NlpD
MAVSAPIKRVILTANESKKKISQGRDAIKSVGKIILKRTKVKREAFAQTNLFRKRREESEKRMMLEDELEAPRVVTTPTGPQQIVQATGTRGFFDRILGFIGYLSAGWIMNNLPTWIAMGKEFVARLQKAGEIVSGFFNNTIKLFANVGNILGALGQNLLQFDFFDTSNRVKTAMGDLNFTMENLTSQIEEAFGLLTTPLTQGKYSGEEIPEVGTKQTDEGAYVEPPPYSGSAPSGSSGGALPGAYDIASKLGANKEQWDIYRNTLAKIESGGRYDVPGGSGQHYDGRYQMGAAAKEDAARILGIPYPGHSDNPNDPRRVAFRKNPELQERMFAAFTLANHGYLSSNRTYQSKETTEQKLQILGYAHNQGAGGAAKWLRTGRVGKDGFGTAGTAYSDALARNFKSRVNPYPNQQVPSTPRPTQTAPAVTTSVIDQFKGKPGGAAGIITSERGMRLSPTSGKYRMHHGIDIAPAGRGYFVALKLSGKVNLVAFDSGGYGNYVDIKSENTIYRFAHLAKVYVKQGQTYNGATIGEIGSTGGSTGIHLHFEVRPGGGASINPRPYLGLLSIGRQLTGIAGKPLTVSSLQSTPATPAQISAPPQQTNMVPFSLTPERRGQDIIVIDQPRQQQNIITPAASAGGPSPSPIGDFQLLNNFIKNKLLLDLAYL